MVAAVQADNGIIFNSLTEGNGTLTIGTASGQFTSGSPFTTNRPIAVGGEVATINVNGNAVALDGPLVSLGVDGDGIGNADGISDLTIDDNSSANNGSLVLSTASPDFYGNIIIGNNGAPTVDVMSDAALGSTTGLATGSGQTIIGEVELNGGIFQTGASFSAPERDFFLGGGSTFDVDGNTTSWGTMTDVQRTLEIKNSSTTTAGAVAFSNLTISATAILQLAGGTKGETVTFTNGIVRTGNDTLVIQPSSTSSLSSTEKVFSSGSSTTLVNTIAPVWIVENNDVSGGGGPYDFVNYGANGYVKASYDSTATLNGSTGADVVALSGAATLGGSASVYALNTEGKTVTIGSNTLTIGDGTNAAGLILASGTSISGGTLAFGGSEGVIWLSGSNPTISSQITGTGGLDFSGSGTVAISTAANVSGAITVDSGTVVLSATNVFAGDAAGIELTNVKSKPSAAKLTISANNQFTELNSVGNNSTVTVNSGAALTLGDTINNLSSTLSATITESGTAAAGALTFDGSGLFDLSGGKITLLVGSTIIVNDTAQLRVVASEFSANSITVNLAGAGSQLQFAQNGGGQFANAITGNGELHLIGGTLQLTETAGANTYSGGTTVETGSTPDLTTNQVSTGNANITDAGGLIVFDQDFAGIYSGVISDGQEMGTGPMMSGSLDIDDSVNDNASNNDVTLSAVQTYSGATYVEAGTLTLGVANALEDSSGVTLGRVGGAVDSQTATLVLDASNQLSSLSSDADNTTLVVLNGETLTLTPASGTDSVYGGVVSDGTPTGGSVVVDGAGTVTFTGDNTFTGGVTIDEGTFEAGNASAAGTGPITLSGADTTLKIDQGDVPANTIDGFTGGDTIDLAGITLDANGGAQLEANNVLKITEDGNTYDLNLNASVSYAGDYFHVAADSSGTGIAITEIADPILTVDDGSSTPIGAAAAGNVAFTLTGLDLGDAGSVTFTDGGGHTVVVSVSSSQASYSANLASLADGTITSALTLIDNAVEPVAGNSVSLDQDLGEQAALSLSADTSVVGSSAESAVPFTIAGLDPEDTGTVTFTDQNGNTVKVSVTGTQTSYTANLSGLAVATVTSTLAVNTDPAGNTFTPVAGPSITLGSVGAGQIIIVHDGNSTGVVYSNIQTAINAASAGDTIEIGAGTYSGQYTVSGAALNGLTIEGIGAVTVEAPTSPLAETDVSPISGNAIDGIFTVDGASNVTISGLMIDGLDEGANFAAGQPGEASLVGIAYVNATGGTVNNVTVTGTREIRCRHRRPAQLRHPRHKYQPGQRQRAGRGRGRRPPQYDHDQQFHRREFSEGRHRRRIRQRRHHQQHRHRPRRRQHGAERHRGGRLDRHDLRQLDQQYRLFGHKCRRDRCAGVLRSGHRHHWQQFHWRAGQRPHHRGLTGRRLCTGFDQWPNHRQHVLQCGRRHCRRVRCLRPGQRSQRHLGYIRQHRDQRGQPHQRR